MVGYRTDRRISLPRPPIRVSVPAPPFRILLALLPVRTLFERVTSAVDGGRAGEGQVLDDCCRSV